MFADALQTWAGPGSAVGLLAATVWLVFTGRLVPRRVHERAVAAEERRAADWKEAYQAELQRAEIRDRQMDEILAAIRNRPREAA